MTTAVAKFYCRNRRYVFPAICKNFPDRQIAAFPNTPPLPREFCRKLRTGGNRGGTLLSTAQRRPAFLRQEKRFTKVVPPNRTNLCRAKFVVNTWFLLSRYLYCTKRTENLQTSLTHLQSTWKTALPFPWTAKKDGLLKTVRIIILQKQCVFPLHTKTKKATCGV